MASPGFPPEAFAFFEGLAADNSKPYWQANRSTYDESVKAPMQALLDALADYGPFNVFRPYNDVRFAKGRPPYKEQIGAVGENDGGTAFYVELSASGLRAGTGYYAMAADQLERFRSAVADDHRGGELQAICADLQRKGYEIGAMAELKTAPRGVPKDHPRVELLRRKGLAASRAWARAAWMHKPAVAGRVREAWQGAGAMNDWLEAHVGPSTLPPADWRR